MTDQPDLKAREIMQKVVDDAFTRFVCLKPAYDSVDLGVALLRPLLSRVTDLEAERDNWKAFAECETDAVKGYREIAHKYNARVQAAESRLALADRLAEAGKRWVLARQVALTLTDKLPSDEFKQAWHELGESEWAMSAALTAYEENTSSKDLTTGEDDD